MQIKPIIINLLINAHTWKHLFGISNFRPSLTEICMVALIGNNFTAILEII